MKKPGFSYSAGQVRTDRDFRRKEDQLYLKLNSKDMNQVCSSSCVKSFYFS